MKKLKTYWLKLRMKWIKMKYRTKPSDPRYSKLMKSLWKSKRRIWREVFNWLNKPNNERVAINISKINRNTKENEIVLVPGKVLSNGNLDHKLASIAAVSFSKSAREKISNDGVITETIEDLLNRNPEGRNVKIIV
jgi:large subunit ribosomal protein L18e